ncbi:MAG: hypothetical protein AAFR63_17445 [Cyanobacteria bacterium J06631_6]
MFGGDDKDILLDDQDEDRVGQRGNHTINGEGDNDVLLGDREDDFLVECSLT